MSGQLTLGVDIGTTNVKACVLDTATATVIASAAAEPPLHHPRPSWAEQQADEYWDAVVGDTAVTRPSIVPAKAVSTPENRPRPLAFALTYAEQ